MDDLQDLYQEMILDHNRRPRNCRKIEVGACSAEGHNPLCGDRVKVFVQMDGDVVRDVAFEGSGCAISTASASMMTEAVKGRTRQQVKDLFHRFHDMVTGAIESSGQAPAESTGLGKLAVFSGVGKYPARVKCATLAWHTVNAAMDQTQDVVTTE